MKLHSNAALTVAQRLEVKRLFEIEKVSVMNLATRFCVHPTTIKRWIKRETPEDKSCVPKRRRRVVTPAYEQAVIKYRTENPAHGAVRIALELKAQFPIAHRGTVFLILQKQKLTCPKKAFHTRWQIPVGRHRLQMDVQQLPAIKGNKGFEYKISLIHLRTRWKYSEIHPDMESHTIAEVYQRALDNLPPFLSSGQIMR